MSVIQTHNLPHVPAPITAGSVDEAIRDKVLAAEQQVSLVRLGIVLFGSVIYLLMDQTGTIPWLAHLVIVVAGAYSLYVHVLQPYRRFPILLSSYFSSISDAALICLWIHATGGFNSSFYGIMYPAIISIAFRYSYAETMMATFIYAGSYALLMIATGETAGNVTDLIVRLAYFTFAGMLSARFAREALGQIRAKLDLRNLAASLETETRERQRAETALARYAEELEGRIATATAELRAAKERFEAILNSSSDAMALSNVNETLEQVNPAFQTLLGLSDQSPVTGRLFDFIASDQVSKLESAIDSVRANLEPVRIEAPFRRADGTYFDADVAIAPLRATGSGAVSLVYNLRDVTERKRAEENLRRALEKERDLSELKARFTSMVTHEFRTPLASIQTAADMLSRYNHRLSDERKTEYVTQVMDQVKSLTALLEDMLTLSRAEQVGLPVNRTSLDLDRLCRDTIREIQLIAQDHLIQYAVMGASATVALDGKLIRHALSNLLSNAVKYSPPGSAVDVRLMYETDHLLICVQDTGIGIPEEDQQRLFELFHRARNVGTTQGTGLGLAIVKQVAEAHGGSLTFESNIGVGTRFDLRLPLNSPTS